MNYTILYTEDLASGQSIDITKDGTTYSVNYYDKETNSLIHKRFKTIDEAQSEYIKIINYFIHGVYNFEQRSKDLRKEVN